MNAEQMAKRTELKSVIKQCFMDMYVVARADMKKHFKADKKQGKQWNGARSLVFLADVAKNPDKHFAPEYTNAAWNKRTFDYMEKSSLSKQDIAKHGVDYVAGITKGSLVWGPGDVVADKIKYAFQNRDVWNFCNAVQNFYYQDNYETYVNERYIKDFAAQVSKWAKVAQSKSCVSRNLNEFVFGGYQRQ